MRILPRSLAPISPDSSAFKNSVKDAASASCVRPIISLKNPVIFLTIDCGLPVSLVGLFEMTTLPIMESETISATASSIIFTGLSKSAYWLKAQSRYVFSVPAFLYLLVRRSSRFSSLSFMMSSSLKAWTISWLRTSAIILSKSLGSVLSAMMRSTESCITLCPLVLYKPDAVLLTTPPSTTLPSASLSTSRTRSVATPSMSVRLSLASRCFITASTSFLVIGFTPAATLGDGNCKTCSCAFACL